MEVAASGETRGDQTDTGVDGISAVSPDAMRPGDRSREYLNEWIENVMELDPDLSMPPTYIVKHNDLLEACWGWKRLVAYNSYDVQWCDYKKYLGDYFNHNAGEVDILCAKQKPKTVGLVVAAANLCIKLEKKLLRYCRDSLTPEDIRLSKDIKNRAKLLMESNDVSSVAAAALVCIAKESELIYEFLVGCTDWDNTRSVAFGNRIRRSAWNLMLYRGSKSADAVAGALLGLAIEAKLFHGYVVSEDFSFSDHEVCCKIRKCTAALLTELEGKLAQETADDEKSKLEKKRKKLEKERSQKKMKNEGNETKLHTGVSAAVTQETADDEKSKLEKKRKKLEKKERSQKKMKNEGNETKVEIQKGAESLASLHTGVTVAVTEELEAEGQPGGEFSEDLSVFVGNLPFSINDAQLTELFAQAGSVKKAKIVYDKYTQTSRGFGFVSMSSVKEVDAAIKNFNGHLLGGRKLTVRAYTREPCSQRGPRDDAKTVFVGNISWSVKESALRNLFSQQGEVLEVKIPYDPESGKPKGFGFVTYASAEEAQNAISKLDGTTLYGRKIWVKESESKSRQC